MDRFNSIDKVNSHFCEANVKQEKMNNNDVDISFNFIIIR